ncbi:uncharacterized protein LODBEIA_P19620 [Lodderomyces beijingensis]|uniref:Proteasome assembly chaperone 1 n=1 Tax=Lodderomyces beijingensis TaxID=1775926 RepID=A0ABP0ZHV0_9ASCO
MLIKPATEIRNPRHTLDDDDLNDDSQPNPIPQVQTTLDPSTAYDSVLIVPNTISLIQSQLPSAKTVGRVVIDYPELYNVETEQLAEYDEDEQLYAAMKQEHLKTEFPKLEIPIMASNRILCIAMPHFKNIITYNILARDLVKSVSIDKEWVLLSPSNLNNGQTVNKLESSFSTSSNPVLAKVPSLQPPHTITGASAAILSQLNLAQAPHVTTLVLDSEGQLGYEKSDNDAIVDTAYILASVLPIDQQAYVESISSKVRKFNGYSNLGMYI